MLRGGKFHLLDGFEGPAVRDRAGVWPPGARSGLFMSNDLYGLAHK